MWVNWWCFRIPVLVSLCFYYISLFSDVFMVQVLVMFFWCKYYCCSYDASIDNAFMILVQFIPLCAFSKNKCTYNHKHPSIVEWHIQKLFNNFFHGMRKMLVVHPFKGEWNKTQHLFAICDFFKAIFTFSSAFWLVQCSYHETFTHAICCQTIYCRSNPGMQEFWN